MHLVTHGLLGWVLAESVGLSRRDRALVTVAAIAPDLDGLGVVAEFATRNTQQPLLWFSDYHHVLCHNVGFALAFALFAVAIADTRTRTTVLVWLSFHLHLLADVIGSRGPDGSQWPVPYLLPFSDAVQWTWTGQWALNAWPNLAITAAALAVSVVFARRRGYSPVDLISPRADATVVAALHERWPLKRP